MESSYCFLLFLILIANFLYLPSPISFEANLGREAVCSGKSTNNHSLEGETKLQPAIHEAHGPTH